MKEDLHYLSSVFGKIDLDQAMFGKCVVEGIRHCRYKVAVRLTSSHNARLIVSQELVCIAERLESGLQSNSRKKRAWAALKATTQSKHIQRFRESLTETKSTLALAMLHQWYFQCYSY